MLPYWLLLAVYSTGAVLSPGRTVPQDRMPWLLALAGLFAALMVGLRYDVGADWEPYQLIFWETRFMRMESAILRSDPAFGLLNWAVRQLGLKFWVVNLVCALILLYGLTRFASRQTSPWLAVCIAIPYMVIVVGMGFTRQATALGLVFLALVAVGDRSFARFLLWMVLASAFHRSALLLLPIVGMSYSRNRVMTAGLVLVATAIGYFFIVAPEIDTYVARYSGAEQGAIVSEGTLVRIAMNVVPALLFLSMSRRFPVTSDIATTWRTFSMLALASLAAFAYFGPNTAIDRVAIYLTPLQVFVFGNLPAVLAGKNGVSRLAIILTIAYAAIVQSIWLVFAGNAKFWIPYQLYPL